MAGSAVPACGFYVEREGKRRIKDVFYLFVLFLFWSEQQGGLIGWLVGGGVSEQR